MARSETSERAPGSACRSTLQETCRSPLGRRRYAAAPTGAADEAVDFPIPRRHADATRLGPLQGLMRFDDFYLP